MTFSKRQYRALARALGVAGCLILAGQAQAETLEEALISAYISNPNLESQRASLRAVDELVPQALAGWRPRVSLDGSTAYSDTETDRGDDRDGSSSATLSVTQSLYAGGSTVAGVNRAENLVRAERAGLLTQEQSILLSAVDAYTATWRDRAVLELAINNELRLQRQLQATRDRFEVGEVARTDVAQAEASLAGAQSDIQQAKADLAASSASYREVIGVDPGELDRPMSLADLPGSAAEAHEIAGRNPLVLAGEYRLRAARDDVDIARADLLPSLDLNGSVRYADNPSTTLDRQRQAQVGLSVSLPLYQGGSTYSTIRQNRQTVIQQQRNLDAFQREVQRSVTTNWEALVAATASIVALEQSVRANRIALEGVQEEAYVGQRTVLDVLDAEQALFESSIALVRAQRTEVLASYALKSAVGELTVVDLDLDVMPYNMETYYNRQRERLFGLD